MHIKINILEIWQEKQSNYAERLRDVRFVGLLVFLVIALLISWSGVKVINTNYGLQKQISQLSQENAVQQLANTNMQLQNQYYETPQYLDIAARQNFGLAAPGETLLLVPRSVALAHSQALPDQTQAQQAIARSKQPAYQRHFQAWMNFFLHRQTAQ